MRTTASVPPSHIRALATAAPDASLSLWSWIRRVCVGRRVRRRWARGRRRRRECRQSGVDQRRAQPDCRTGARRRAGAFSCRRTPARHHGYGRSRARDRGVADLRRHAEPAQRQPRPHLPRTRLRGDWPRPRHNVPLPRRRRPQHRAARHHALGGHPGAGARVGQEVRRRLRRVGQSRVPPRRHGTQGLPQAAVDTGRPQPRRRRQRHDRALPVDRRAAREHQHPRRRDDEVHQQHVARAEGGASPTRSATCASASRSTATR